MQLRTLNPKHVRFHRPYQMDEAPDVAQLNLVRSLDPIEQLPTVACSLDNRCLWWRPSSSRPLTSNVNQGHSAFVSVLIDIPSASGQQR
jgi:hypothetical protein